MNSQIIRFAVKNRGWASLEADRKEMIQEHHASAKKAYFQYHVDQVRLNPSL